MVVIDFISNFNLSWFLSCGGTRAFCVSRQNLLNLALPELRDTLAHQVGV